MAPTLQRSPIFPTLLAAALMLAGAGCGNHIKPSEASTAAGCALSVDASKPTSSLGIGWGAPRIVNQAVGQTFQLDSLSKVSTIDLRLQAVIPDNVSFGSARIRVRIFPGEGTVPAEDETPLARAERSAQEIAQATREGSSMIRFTLDTAIGLVEKTTYWIVVDADYAQSSDKYVAWFFAPRTKPDGTPVTDAHTGGQSYYRSNSLWTQATSSDTGQPQDFLFRVGCQ